MAIIKKIFGQQWNFMRLFRLALGIIVIVQAILVKDFAMGLLGILFTAMPLFNMGCCAIGGCAAPAEENTDPSREIVYEEVK